MNIKILEKLKELPRKPGCYIMRNRKGVIIYVGKAKILQNRVRSYFRRSTFFKGHPKVRLLVREVDSLEWIVVKTEDEALLLENKLINDNQPKYNILLRDDKHYMGIRGTKQEPFPRLTPFRLKRDDGGVYFGPFPTNGQDIYPVIDYLQRRFGIRRCNVENPSPETYKHCNNDQICTCSAPCIGKISQDDYQKQFEEACKCLRGERIDIIKELKEQMLEKAENFEYEAAASYKQIWEALKDMAHARSLGPQKTEADHKEDALNGLKLLAAALNLPGPPKVIECFDISNTSGLLSVASMVVAVDGLPCKRRYRTFNMQGFDGPNDPAMIAQAVTRRYTYLKENSLPMPDLIVLDGGITQLRAARKALSQIDIHDIPTIGIAEKLEELVLDNGEEPLFLPRESEGLTILRRLRDEAHRFAITHHRARRAKTIRESILDEIEGIGPKKKILLLRHFGSVSEISKQSEETLSSVPGITPALARSILNTVSAK